MPATIQTLRSGATAHPEEIVNFLTSRIVEAGGVFDKSGNHFKCAEQAVPAMSVKVSQGYAFIPTTDASMAYPSRLYDGDYSATITSNASGNPRIDAIVLYIDLAATANSGATNVSKIAVIAGTPAASPVAPTDFAVGSVIGASNPFIRLSHVTVASGASSIVNANITDKRNQVRVSQKFDFAKTGDVKMSIKATADEGWILMNDCTIGDIGSGATFEGAHLQSLFTYLDTDFGQTPTAAWASGGKITVPAMDGRSPVGYKSADADYNALGMIGGSKTVTLTTSELPAHNHSFSGTTGTESVGHTHSIDTSILVGGAASSGYGTGLGTGGAAYSKVGTISDTPVSELTTGISANHTHAYSGTTSTTSAASAFSIKNPYRVFNFMIKW